MVVFSTSDVGTVCHSHGGGERTSTLYLMKQSTQLDQIANFLQENMGSNKRPHSSCFSQREMLINSFLPTVAAVARVVSVRLPRECRGNCGFPLLLVLSPTGGEISSLRPFSACSGLMVPGLAMPCHLSWQVWKESKRSAAIWAALWDLIFIPRVCSCSLTRVPRCCVTCSL